MAIRCTKVFFTQSEWGVFIANASRIYYDIVNVSYIILNNLFGGCSMKKDAVIVMKKQLNVTELAGEKVMIDFESGKYFLIKGAGNDIWDLLQTEITPAEIIENLLAEYDVTS